MPSDNKFSSGPRIRASPEQVSFKKGIQEMSSFESQELKLPPSQKSVTGRRAFQRPYSDDPNGNVGSVNTSSSSYQSPPLRAGRLVPLPSSQSNHRSSNSFTNSNIHQNSWSRNMADNLSYRWRLFGSCGVICLLLSSLSILWLNNISLFMDASPKSNSNQKSSGVPDWFSNRDIPKILKVYSDKHKRYVNSPRHAQSRFLIHEIPMNETQLVDTILGLVSTFMLGIVTDRAVLIDWTDEWMTPLDSNSNHHQSSASEDDDFNQVHMTSSSSTSSSSPSSTGSITSSSSSGGGSGWNLFGAAFGANGDYDDDLNGGGGGGGSSGLVDDIAHNGDGGDGSTTTTLNATASRKARLVQLMDILAEPDNLHWDFHEFQQMLRDDDDDDNGGSGIELPVVLWDPLGSIEEITCHDLKALLGNDNKYIKITPGSSSLLYYMPLIMVNPFYSDYLASSFQDGLSWVFADMINYFIRPVNEVVDAIERFKVRYMDGNTVVGMQMSVMPGHGTWLGDGMMPVKQQDLFFSTASTLLTPSSTSGLPFHSESDSSLKGVVYLLITDDQTQIQGRFQELEAKDQINGAGVVAILAASGDGPSRVQLELQELWMLGITDLALVTPGSRTGVVGAARTHTAPHVIMSEDSVHASTAPYPCFAQFGSIQHTSCFVPSMLSKIPPDSLVPC